MFSPTFYPGWGLNPSFMLPPKPLGTPPVENHTLPRAHAEEMSEHVREERLEKSSPSDKSSASGSVNSEKKSNEDMNDSDGSSASDSDSMEHDIDTAKMDPTHREILEKLKRQEQEEREEIERELKAHKEALSRQEDIRKAHLKEIHEKELKAAHAAVSAAQRLHSPNSAEELRLKRPPLDRASFDYLNALYMDRAFAAARVSPPTSEPTSEASGSHHWTFEEQFKQLYELSDDPKRKEFLDDLFSYMQKRGTPVNRIPIMAKQTLDLYQLFKLVVSKGGLVEVINKKLWREITKGLNLPSSITSAAFTLRTQYMKYLYPYECEKLKLSSPSELQAAIDGNRREGRRSSYGYEMSPGAPTLVSPHLNGGFFNGLGALNGHPLNGHLNGFGSPPLALCHKPPHTHTHSDDDRTPPSSPPHDLSMRNRIAMEVASRVVEEARKTERAETVTRPRDIEDEPVMKKVKRESDGHRPHAQSGLPSTHIKVTNRSESQDGDNSLVVSMEINGIMYQGVLFAQQSA